MKTDVDDYFRVLELPADATPEEIRIRYRQMIRVYHPDRYSDPLDKEFVEHMLKRANEAYNALIHLPKSERVVVSPAKPELPTQPLPPPRIISGVPTLFAFILIGIAFVLGTIFARVFNFAPITTGSATKPALALVTEDAASPLSTITATPVATPTNAESALSTATGDKLVLAASASLAAPNSSTVSEPTTTPLPTVTDVPTATATNEPTVTEQPTATEIPPTATEPPATATLQPTEPLQPTDTIQPTEPVQPPDTSQPTDTIVPTETALPVVDTPTVPIPPPITPFVNTGAGILLTVPGQYNIFVRATTSIQGAQVALIAAGEQLLVVGRTFDNYWLRVALADGRQGWVYAETVGASPELLAQLAVVNP